MSLWTMGGESHGEEITDSGGTAGCRLARVVIETLDHLHYIAGIQPRIADVGKLVAELVGHLVIRQVAMLGHVVVEFNSSSLRSPVASASHGQLASGGLKAWQTGRM